MRGNPEHPLWEAIYRKLPVGALRRFCYSPEHCAGPRRARHKDELKLLPSS